MIRRPLTKLQSCSSFTSLRLLQIALTGPGSRHSSRVITDHLCIYFHGCLITFIVHGLARFNSEDKRTPSPSSSWGSHLLTATPCRLLMQAEKLSEAPRVTQTLLLMAKSELRSPLPQCSLPPPTGARAAKHLGMCVGVQCLPGRQCPVLSANFVRARVTPLANPSLDTW